MPATSSTSASEAAGTSRKSVTIAVAAVAAALLVLDQAYGLILDRLFLRSTYNPAARVVLAGADTVVVGASGAHYALDPTVLGGKTYNAASDGQSGFYAVSLLNALPAGSIKRVIYGFDSADMISGLKGENVKHLAKFAPWSRNDAQFTAWMTHGKPIMRVKLLSGLYRYRGIGNGVIRGYLRPRHDGNGYEPLKGHMQSRPEGEVATERDAVSPDGVAMLQAMAAAVRRHDAELIIFMPPMYKYDRATLPSAVNVMAAMRQVFSGPRHCDLSVIDDARMADVFTNHEYYRDGAHSNHAGAQVFSAIMRDTIAARCGK
jgi:hypothetical protein